MVELRTRQAKKDFYLEARPQDLSSANQVCEMSLRTVLGLQRFGRARRGFTLVEILIVVVILGILAALVIPQFSTAASSSRESTLRMDLHRIREQIEIYRQQHSSTAPTLENFTDQLTMASNEEGATAPLGTAGYRFGPYVMSIPINPNTQSRDVTAGAVGSSAWYYDETTGDFRANDSEASRTY
jgi:prepilin-type N-terminal cleavage/methylation domain-containing protein